MPNILSCYALIGLKLKLKALSHQPERQLESGLTEHQQNESDKSNKSHDPYKRDKQDESNE